MNPQDILTPAELARRLKVPQSWVFEKTRKRQKNPLPVFRIGRYVRFHWPDVAAWLDSTRPSAGNRLAKARPGRAA
jgi:predicted DNA-binding transcriptional regulator AlpA